jgi:hypothetical protein
VVYEPGLILVPACRSRIDEGHRVILGETSKVNSSKGIDAMTTAHDIDWDGVMDVAADFAEKSWLLARRPSRRRFDPGIPASCGRGHHVC